MAPEMEHAAGCEGLTQQGSRQRRPLGRAAVSNKPPQIAEGGPLDRVPREGEEAVRISLNRGRQQHESRFLSWEVERNHLDGAQAEVAGLSDHFHVTIRILACRRTKREARQTGVFFNPRLGTDDFLPSLLVGGTGENNMMEGLCANLESAAQLPDLRRLHRPVLCRLGYVKGAVKAILREQSRHAQIQLMTVVPTGRDVCLLHSHPATHCFAGRTVSSDRVSKVRS